MDSGKVRLNKFLAESGVCSRREADRLIEAGKVVVNGHVASVGEGVGPGDRVEYEGRVLKGMDRTVVLAFYKPKGVTTSEKDEHADRLVSDYIDYPVRVTYAGRLDKDSEGLILLTNDGSLIDHMMRGSNRHEKEYVVTVDKELTEEICEKLRKGIYLPELKVKTRPCKVVIRDKNTMSVTLTQGLNRQIRRMCDQVGLKVKKLKRVRVMSITLGKLGPGEYRELTEAEINSLRKGIHV
ncbi:MAG: rRNA pseudouridine synthase [Lachnospiraceae bacterium]|nr:rRNA pseudouridine synthase [Lachnospiraceae bacterium]